MGKYSDQLPREVRLERMRPAQVEQAIRQRPSIYVPFGSIEWHGVHNPVGLDAIKAHEQLVGLALRLGGVVYPPVFFGSGGGHLDWPHTYMVASDLMIPLVTSLLWGFERQGYQQAILLSGHYPNRSEYLDAAAQHYLRDGGRMKVLALIENQIPDGKGDHASKYETSYMLYLHPETVDMGLLPDLPGEISDPQRVINFMVAEYKDHPCYGLVGIDPRHNASAQVGQELTDNLLDSLQRWLETGSF